MAKRVFSRTRSPRKRTSEFSAVSDGGMFESRPFVVQSKVGEKSDLKTSLMQAERYRHHVSQMNPSGFSDPQPVQSQWAEGTPMQLAPIRGARKGKTVPTITPYTVSESKTKKRKTGILYDSETKTFISGKRPAFPNNYKPHYIKDFNDKRPPSERLTSSSKLDELGLSRNHRVSHDDQQNLIKNYLNGGITKDQLIESSNALYEKDGKGFGYNKMVENRTKLLTAKTPKEREKYASLMLTYLNASSLNVSIGNSHTNSTIGEHADFNFAKTPKGKHYTLTPKSKQVLGFGYQNISKPMMSPGKTRILSSHVNNGQGGFVPYNDKALTPTSHKSMEKLMNEGIGNVGKVSPENVKKINDF